MRGMDERSGLLFSYVDLEGRVRGSHPLRAIRLIVNEALSVLTARFEALYSPFGRLSDGQRSLFHLAMTAATLDVEARNRRRPGRGRFPCRWRPASRVDPDRDRGAGKQSRALLPFAEG
jgi:hypothetical protein